MADETQGNLNAETGTELFPKDWRDQVKLYGGRKGFIRQELKRLGMWPPQRGSKYKHVTAKEEIELAQLYEQLKELRRPLLGDLDELDAKIAEARKTLKNVGSEARLAAQIEELIAQTRVKRIERVKREREERRVKRAAEKVERDAKHEAWRKNTLSHLGRDVSGGLQYVGGDVEKLQRDGLPVLQTAQEVAQLLELTTGQLAWLTYHRGASAIDHYQHFTIPKKSGGVRAISAPKKTLKTAQRAVLDKVLGGVAVHEAAVAFRPKTHIGHNAARHAGAQVVLRIDLKDFFPSIKLRRVKRTFQELGYNEGVSTLFALLCTESPRAEITLDGKTYFAALSERQLPQGAPTSPAITNVMCRHLDARMSGAAAKMGFIYTRYADDLVFSSRDLKANVGGLKALAQAIIAEEKLTVNADKLAVLRPHARQSVTGLVVNAHKADASGHGDAKPRVSREQMRKFRAFLHGYETRGRDAMTEQLGQDALAYAQGYLSFIHMVAPEQEAKITARHPWLERRKRE